MGGSFSDQPDIDNTVDFGIDGLLQRFALELSQDLLQSMPLRVDDSFSSRTSKEHIQLVQYVPSKDALLPHKVDLPPARVVISIQTGTYREHDSRSRASANSSH